jgi:hypothetical protein
MIKTQTSKLDQLREFVMEKHPYGIYPRSFSSNQNIFSARTRHPLHNIYLRCRRAGIHHGPGVAWRLCASIATIWLIMVGLYSLHWLLFDFTILYRSLQ